MTLRSSETPQPDVVSITAETSRFDPDSCKFSCDRVLHDGPPATYSSGEASHTSDRSPLAERLMALDGVGGVVISHNTVTVRRVTDQGTGVPWSALRPQVAAAIREHVASGAPAVEPHAGDSNGASGDPADDRIAEALRDLCDRDINPAIASHGGRISVVGVERGRVSILMSGGCQGCASSASTLRQGFETKARLVAPGITEIVDVTDHAAGTSPFFVPGAEPADHSSPLANPVRLGRKPGA